MGGRTRTTTRIRELLDGLFGVDRIELVLNLRFYSNPPLLGSESAKTRQVFPRRLFLDHILCVYTSAGSRTPVTN